MARRSLSKILLVSLSFLATAILFAQQTDPETALGEAAAAFEHADAAGAEQKLEAVLKKYPGNLRALILMGAVLDSQQRFHEAESCYERALREEPHSAQVLNNVANHYLASGNRRLAGEFYSKALAVDSHHINANLQLAQMSVKDGQGRQALVYLSHLPDSESADPVALLLRARALSLTGQCSDASALLEKLQYQAEADSRLHYSVGMAFAQCKLYPQAEGAFSRALDADPRNFDILYNLGLAALEAGHSDRAATALEAAAKERPEDTDSLYALSRVYMRQERPVDAAALLTKAQKLAPKRADVDLLLAQISSHLGFYEDAAATYTRYLELKPTDDVARRERGMAFACANQSAKALSDLQWYVRKHPGDATGFYELAIAQYPRDRAMSLKSLDRALALDPAMIPARYTRAVLNIESKKPEASLDDLRLVLKREPSNYQVLARLGQAYLALNRASDAAQTLKQAVDLAPNQPAILMYYRDALERAGNKQEAAAVLARLKQVDSTIEGRRPQAGLIDYLRLPAADQRARYLANLRKNVDANPADARWKIRLGKELLTDGRTDEALELFRSLRAEPDPEILASSGRILLDFEQYELARQFLESAVHASPSLSAARLDLAIALFRSQGPDTALVELDKTPEADRKGDYYLLRAQILDAQGKIQDAATALNQGIRAAPTRATLYYQAAGFLLKHKLYRETLALLEQASRLRPDDRELLLAQVVTLNLLRRNDDAEKLLEEIQTRWPEWERVYLLKGILLEIDLKSKEARQTLETAIALGANTPEAYYYEALAITHSAPDELDAAQNAIAHAMALTSQDPYIYLLAGKIALARKDYATAIARLLDATHLQPALLPAHYALRNAYRALGEKQKSQAEVETIKHIASETSGSDESPFSMENFLFTVRPPG